MTTDKNYLKDLFIDEAKPALQRHSGGGGDTEAAYNNGYAAGTKDENRAMWDAIQNCGEKKVGYAFFRTPTWTDENFKPIHTVYAGPGTFSDGVDNSSTGIRCGMTDLRPETVGVDIDWSLCNNFNGLLIHTPVKYVGVIDMRAAQYASTMFYNAKELEEVEKIILPSTALSFGTLGFSAVSLKEIRFEGTLQTSVNFASISNLTLDSAKNILTHLKDFSTETGKEHTCTVSFHANTWTLLDADNTAPGGVSWRDYVSESLCWNT